ncbi:YqjK-like family protein [Pseudorhodoferax sp. Leaf267]|uniref:YqjK-like family protein n=1 Tax=Pseudorhodoferax sp. Leaf267 TaxID=1736316 RepID=UPI0006F34474|nr:YqjK-like family protein [Pseudorhodoferax sp. Leaf267]KQP12180.1 hypothetical protein ASF43_21940 [Pseudorhodoferax sp. Leaf267]
MARRKSLAELQRERGRLLERIAGQRETLAVQCVPVLHLLQFGERIAQTVQSAKSFVQKHPWAMGSVAAVLALRRPRKLGRWARRGLFLWRSWRTARTVFASVQRQLDQMG